MESNESNGSNLNHEDEVELEQQTTKNENQSHVAPAPLHLTQSFVSHPESLPAEAAFVAILCMAQFTTQVGLGQSIAPLHIIGAWFHLTNPGQLSWFPAAYSLTVGTFILIAGRLGDLYGHKKFFVGGFFWYALWSVLAGFSVYSNNIFFDCCRAFQGIGPAFLLPNSIAILGRSYKPGLRKQVVFSLFGAMAPTGFVVGATFSSLLAQKAWWPWGYWILGIFCLILALVGIYIIPHTPTPQHDKSFSMFTHIDTLGSLTGVSGLVLVNFAWNQAPIVGWNTPYTYVLLIIGLLFLSLFGYIESHATFPLIPFSVMNADVAFLLACISCGWASYSIWLYYFLQFLEVCRDETPLLMSAQIVPVIPSGFGAALTTAFILGRWPGSTVMMIALTAFLAGSLLVATLPVHQTYWKQTFLSLLVMPWGMDMSFPAATLLLSNAMPREHQGIAASLVNTIVNYSISLALGFAGTIEVHVGVGGGMELVGAGGNGRTCTPQTLKGYRAAQYLGVGLAGLGLFTAAIFSWDTWRRRRREQSEKGKEEAKEEGFGENMDAERESIGREEGYEADGKIEEEKSDNKKEELDDNKGKRGGEEKGKEKLDEKTEIQEEEEKEENKETL
ncbi:hypothetical protein B7494_g6480 [Chlorociboria aeruginascens]|nr:hypothetical protein B7494_g6480 [Chlorociboria aeruginascens]